jgi:ATP-dependent Clp protease, protease subunit
VMLGASSIHMPRNAMLMVHNPWTLAIGDHNELAKASEDLEKMTSVMISTYASKTGKDEEEIRQVLDGETWMTADEALAFGLVDQVEEEKDEEALALAFAALDLSEFGETPEHVEKL